MSIQCIVHEYLMHRTGNAVNYWDYSDMNISVENALLGRPVERLMCEIAATNIQRVYKGLVSRKHWPGEKLFTVKV